MITLPSGRMIGEGQPVFIVAEVGSNWATLEDCLKSISMAKACGADAVKFQAFDEISLYGVRCLTDATPPDSPLSIEELEARGSLRKTLYGQLPIAWLPKLKEKADAVGIEFMCSAFSPELIDAVNSHVNIHKVASAECTHKRMLEKLREIGKLVILSTGGHGLADIGQALDVLGPTPTVLMYCVSAYPARLTVIGSMIHLYEKFGKPVGISDHSLDVACIATLAASKGACVVEKHVNFVGAQGPDADHSIDSDEFAILVSSIRHSKGPLGFPHREEKEMTLRHNRRLIVTQLISHGTKFIEGSNFGIFRSLKDDTHAYGPMMIDEVNGKIARVELKAGNGIGPGDF